MFTQARIKLTVWYLAIIMLLSISFSMVIYRVLSIEIEHFARTQRTRIERQLSEGNFLPSEIRLRRPLPVFDPELVEETKHRLVMMLAIVNGTIFFVSGGLGYLLAGRTLKPIREMLDEQNRFITDASHELRTPLTSLKSAMEVYLRDKKLTLGQAKQLIWENIEEVDKLQSLSDELLLLAQYQKPDNRASFKKISFAEITKKAIRKITPLAKQKSITIHEDTQNTQIEGDKDELCDLLVIFLDNAVKYSSPKTKIEIKSQKTDGSLKISVKDQGIGIDTKDISHIFDRFYRSSSGRLKAGAGGYGLGLSIAKRISDNHQGTIVVESKSGKGSTFTVCLPIKQTKRFNRFPFFS